MSRGYWEELAKPLRAACESALRLNADVPALIDRGPGAAAIRAQAVAVGLVILAQSRLKGGWFEVQSGVDVLRVFGARPSDADVEVLKKLGWHQAEIGGEPCWRCWI